MRPDTGVLPTRYGVCAAAPPRHPACHRPCRLTCGAVVRRPGAAEPPRPRPCLRQGHHRATARHTTPLAGLPQPPVVCRPHAARSPASTGGGAPPRGMTPVHTSSWPQVGHRSGWASPRWAHTVCQSRRTGTSTGGCPSAVRQTARASACVVMVQPIAPHHARLGHRDMQQPPLEKVRHGQRHPLGRGGPRVGLLLPRAIGEGDAVAVPRHQAARS